MPACPKCQSPLETDARFCGACGYKLTGSGEPLTELMTVGGLETVDTGYPLDERPQTLLEPGSVFADRYGIEAVIGRGGMGVVYKASDQLTKQTVALKLIRPERLVGERAIDRLISEGVTARNIRHPNIVAVYDVAQSAGQPYVSMEYLEDQSLRAWHRDMVQQRKDVPLRVAARIIAEIMDGLTAAHAAGVIHRDLKPENIILVGEPTAEAAPLKILDFGIARATANALESGTGTGLGTPRYMAPEQITNADSAGPSADLYSASVIFYELLVDVLPQGHWQPPSGGRSDVPEGIDALIERGLSNRPANRPQSAADYRKALVDAVNMGPGIRRDRPSNDNQSMSPVLKWGGIAAAALLGLVLVAGVANMSPDDPCEGLYGSEYQACLGIAPVDPPPIDLDTDIIDPVDPPPRRDPVQIGPGSLPPPNPYSELSGVWNHQVGSSQQVTVNSNGEFSGSGYSVDGFRMMISGRIDGSNGTYVLAMPEMGLSLSGRFVWDRGCHLDYQTFDPTGSFIQETGRLHVNHAPGAPCP